MKRPGGNLRFDEWTTIDLYTQCQQTQVTRFGADAFCHFFLNGQHNAAGFWLTFEQVADDRRSDVIGNIRRDNIAGLVHEFGDVEVKDVTLYDLHVRMRGQDGFERGN